MKFWELHSVLHRWGVPATAVPDRPEWRRHRESWDRADELVKSGNRALLDEELPNELVLAALEHSNRSYFLDGENLKVQHLGREGDEELSAVEVARRFGGSILEEVEEKASCDVIYWKRSHGWT